MPVLPPRPRAPPVKFRPKNSKRGHGGIEPPTSPTLKENHTTRPMPHIGGQPGRQKNFCRNPQSKKTKRTQGAAGIEPATPGSAIPCSTAELCTPGGGAACRTDVRRRRELKKKTFLFLCFFFLFGGGFMEPKIRLSTACEAHSSTASQQPECNGLAPRISTGPV